MNTLRFPWPIRIIVYLILFMWLSYTLIPSGPALASPQLQSNPNVIETDVEAYVDSMQNRRLRECGTNKRIDFVQSQYAGQFIPEHYYHIRYTAELPYLQIIPSSALQSYSEIPACPLVSTLRAPSPLQVTFSVDRAKIAKDDCAILKWDVEYAQSVYFAEQGTPERGVDGHSILRVCPMTTTTYLLRVISSTEIRTEKVTVVVITPPTPTIPGLTGRFFQAHRCNSSDEVIVLSSPSGEQYALWSYPLAYDPRKQLGRDLTIRNATFLSGTAGQVCTTEFGNLPGIRIMSAADVLENKSNCAGNCPDTPTGRSALLLNSIRWSSPPEAFTRFSLSFVIQNVGEQAYDPGDGSYAVDVSFINARGETWTFPFSNTNPSGTKRLAPARMPRLAPGQSVVITVSDLTFWTGLPDGAIQVNFRTSKSDPRVDRTSLVDNVEVKGPHLLEIGACISTFYTIYTGGMFKIIERAEIQGLKGVLLEVRDETAKGILLDTTIDAGICSSNNLTDCLSDKLARQLSIFPPDNIPNVIEYLIQTAFGVVDDAITCAMEGGRLFRMIENRYRSLPR